MKKKKRIALALAAALMMVLLLAACSDKTIRLGVAGIGGVYQVFGEDYAALQAQNGGRKLEVRETAGSAASLRLLSSGYLQMAVVQADMAQDAYNQTGAFAESEVENNFSTVAVLYQEECHIVVRADSGINTVEELQGKTVITSASQLCSLPVQGICQGGQPVMSFNFGAGSKARVKEAFRFQLALCGGYATLFCLLMLLVPGAVAGLFTSDAALIQYTTWAMRIYMAGFFAIGFQIACQQSFMALGQAKVSLLLACLRKLILLIPLIFLLPHLLPDPVFAVFLAEPVSDITAASITVFTFLSRFDKILDRGAANV